MHSCLVLTTAQLHLCHGLVRFPNSLLEDWVDKSCICYVFAFLFGLVHRQLVSLSWHHLFCTACSYICVFVLVIASPFLPCSAWFYIYVFVFLWLSFCICITVWSCPPVTGKLVMASPSLLGFTFNYICICLSALAFLYLYFCLVMSFTLLFLVIEQPWYICLYCTWHIGDKYN